MNTNKLLFLSIGLALYTQVGLCDTPAYKGTDEGGGVVFSDKPVPNGEKINIQPAQTYTPIPLPAKNADKDKDKNANPSDAVESYQISILQPQDNQGIPTGIQGVDVFLSVTPDLQEGDKIRLLLNDKQYGDLYSTLNISINERLNRGTYTLKAQVVSEKDPSKVKGESSTVTFYQQRASLLLPKRN